MNTILITLGVTFFIFLLCIFLLGISALLTGKSRFRMGMCGRVPTQEKDAKKGCGTTYSCDICGKGSETPKEEE